MGPFLTEFCDNSTIHGVRYFTELKRHWSERLWWMTALLASVWLCSSSIQTIWSQWSGSPTTISFTEKEKPISSIPFPTVTICPQNKALKRKLDVAAIIDSLEEKSKNLSPIELARLDAFVHVCQFIDKGRIFLDRFFTSRENYTNSSIFRVLEDMAPSLDDILLKSVWDGQQFNSDWPDFSSVWTDEGRCYAFNALNSDEIYTEDVSSDLKTVTRNPNVSRWSLDNGYETEVRQNEYPYRVFGTSPSQSMLVFLRLLKEDSNHCRYFSGFKLYLTLPGEALGAPWFFITIPSTSHVRVKIRPKLIITTNELRRYTPKQQGCFFDSERQLRFFKLYTQNNCERECITNFTKILCGCLHFSMPRDKNTKICGASSVMCYIKASIKLFGDDIIDGMRDEEAKAFRRNCNCLPGCTSITYDVEIDKDKNMFENGDPRVEESILEAAFKEPYITTLQRSAMYSYADFLAICGGLLGLFLGISVLSLIEFVYYFTIRLFWSIRQAKFKNMVSPLRPRAPKTQDTLEIPGTPMTPMTPDTVISIDAQSLC